MSKKEEQYAQENGYYRLGVEEIDVDLALTSEEKISLGKSQSESLCEIQRLEDELADIRKEYKNKIDSHKIIVAGTSEMLRKGFKLIKKPMPAFLDTKKNKKHWVDLDTGEIVMTRDAREEDRQSDLIEEDFLGV